MPAPPRHQRRRAARPPSSASVCTAGPVTGVTRAPVARAVARAAPAAFTQRCRLVAARGDQRTWTPARRVGLLDDPREQDQLSVPPFEQLGFSAGEQDDGRGAAALEAFQQRVNERTIVEHDAVRDAEPRGEARRGGAAEGDEQRAAAPGLGGIPERLDLGCTSRKRRAQRLGARGRPLRRHAALQLGEPVADVDLGAAGSGYRIDEDRQHAGRVVASAGRPRRDPSHRAVS